MSVVFPHPFFPTMTLTPGLNSNTLPFLNSGISGRYLTGDFLLSLMTIFSIMAKTVNAFFYFDYPCYHK